MSSCTPPPWKASHHQRLKTLHSPNSWAIVEHCFPEHPYEGELEQEWGIYPPLGESGPVALVAGKSNARLIAASHDMLAVCEKLAEADKLAMPDGSMYIEYIDVVAEARSMARAAIKRVRGE